MKTFARLALAAGLVVSTSALADSITIKYNNPIYTHGSDGMTITADPHAGKSVGVGEFGAKITDLNGVPASIFVDGPDDLLLYCYDIFQTINAGASFTYTLDYTGAQARTLDFLGAVNHVLNGVSGNDPFAWLHPLNTSQSAAIQVGIWESLYDTGNDWNLGSGAFHVTGIDSGTTSQYNSFVGALAQSNSLAQGLTMVLVSRTNQDQITGDPRGLPEPGSIALVALGLVAAGIARRRKA